MSGYGCTPRTEARQKSPQGAPGFGIGMGLTVLYMSLVVLVLLSALLLNQTGLTWEKFWSVATDPRVLASYRVSLTTAALAAFADTILGLLLAWVLVRYDFPGKNCGMR